MHANVSNTAADVALFRLDDTTTSTYSSNALQWYYC